MAAVASKKQCFLCQKDTRTFNCEECSQNFCLNCLTKHVQELRQQLDAMETDHEQFRQTILQEMVNLKNHLLVKEINQWEKDSIEKIKQIAEQSRQMITNYRRRFFNEIENKLNKLTKELKQSREENQFNEIDINQFKEQLELLKDELNQPSNISIGQELTSFINKIVVTIPADQGSKLGDKSTFSSHDMFAFHDNSASAPLVETNESTVVENVNDKLQEHKLSKKQKRRRNQKLRQANKALVPSEALTEATSTLDLNPLTGKPKKSMKMIGGLRMASNNEYFLVCPENKLILLDTEGKEHLKIDRNFEAYDICWSTYLKRFLILSERHLYSLDPLNKKPLTIEISQFTRDMDECTCHENIFMMISDYGGATIEVWDMKLNWKSIACYNEPISHQPGEGICSIRFSSNGTYLGVTLTAPFIKRAYFQIRNWKNMTVLNVVGLPFYE